MPKLIEGARSAEAFRERRRARVKTILTILAALVLAPLTAVAGMAVPGNGYYLSGTLIVLYAIVPFFVSFEGRRPTAREIAVVAVLTALAVAARAAFIWVPHFKPRARRRPPNRVPRGFGGGACQQLHLRPGALDALADARLWSGGARGRAACRRPCVPASEPFLAASYCAGNRGVRAYCGARGSHSGYVHVLLSFHSPHAGAGRGGVPCRPASERHSWGGHSPHAAGRGEPPARPTRPRPREVRFTRSVAPQLPISRAPTACKSRFSRSRFSREPTSLTTFKRLIDHTSKLILFFSGAEKHILFDCTRTLSRVLYVSALGTAKHNILWFRW